MIALGYTRISKKGDDRSVSLDAQKQQIGQYCDRQGFVLSHVVTDDGVSGRKRSRFGRLDEAVKEFRPSCIIYYHQDRLARDVGLADYLKSLAKRGIEIHEAAGAGKVDIKTADGRMVVNIRSAVDAAYAEKIGEKTADALSHKKRNGERYTNIPPLGFAYLDGKLIEHAEEQHALDVLRRCAEAGLGARRALRVLEAGGYSGRKSLTVIHKALERMAP
jgi:DNA invertase Pin-like site-specific DNA recombinase